MIIRQILVYILSLSVGFAPTYAFAQAPDQTKVLKEFYKESGYKAGDEIAPWLAKNSDKIYFKIRTMIERAQMAHPEIKLPNVEVSEYSSGGKVYSRLIFKSGMTQQIADVYETNGKYFAKIDGKVFSFNDLFYDQLIDRNQINPQLTLNQLSEIYKVNPQAAANYQVQFRELVNALTKFYSLEEKNIDRSYSYLELVLSVAYAAEVRSCVVAGHISKIGSAGLCGQGDESIRGKSCGKSAVQCNPLVYGFTAQGAEICVKITSRQPATYVSEQCDNTNKLTDEASRQAFVKNVLAHKERVPTEEGTFFKQLEDQISNAGKACDKSFNEAKFNLAVSAKTPIEYKADDFIGNYPIPKKLPKGKDGKPFDYNEGHRTACAYLMNRLVFAKKAADCAVAKTEAKDKSSCDVPAPISTGLVVAEDPCKNLRDEAGRVSKRFANREIDNKDSDFVRISKNINDLNQHGNVCDISWPPAVNPTPTASPAVVPVVVQTNEDKCKGENAPFYCVCTATTVRGVTCGIIFLGLFALIGRGSKPASMPVGKPGEPETPRGNGGTGGTTTPATTTPLTTKGTR